MTNLRDYMIQSNLLYPELSYQLQGCFFKVYNTLGFGHKELVYQRALEAELTLQKINFNKPKLPIFYNGKKIAVYEPDFVIDAQIIVEIKALEFFPPKLMSQLVYYLKGTHFSLGYLVNFGESKLRIVRRIWTSNHHTIRVHSPKISANPIP